MTVAIMEFVFDAWYVAGWSRNFQHELVPQTILEQNLVFFRQSDNKLVALEDRCPHRLLPLSKGNLIGDNVECGYHGMTFDGHGKCVRIPAQDNLPPSAYVDTYPVEERHGIVWVWMGIKEKADPNLIFNMDEFKNSSWQKHLGDALHIKAHYLNVAENLVDPAHVSFVHPTTLGSAASQDVPVEVSTTDDPIAAWRWIRNAPPVGFFQKFGSFSGNVDRWHYYYLHLPSTAVIDFGSAASDLQLKEDERHKGVRIFAIHFVTPVTRDYTIDHWMHMRNAAVGNDDASKQIDDLFRIAFEEDKEILEAIHKEEQRQQTRAPIRIAIDRAPLVYRKRIKELVNLGSQQR